MKIIVFIANALIQLAAAAVGLFMLLIGLNGYSEKQAEMGLLFFIILAFVSTIGIGLLSVFTTQRLAAKPSLGKFGASAIAIFGFAIIGIVILIIGVLAAVFLVEALRK
jgi:hypothetical protein